MIDDSRIKTMINIALIEKRRKQLKITKYKMSKKLDGSTQIYYDISRRKSTTLKTLDKIADILGLKAKDLII